MGQGGERQGLEKNISWFPGSYVHPEDGQLAIVSTAPYKFLRLERSAGTAYSVSLVIGNLIKETLRLARELGACVCVLSITLGCSHILI